MQEKGLTREKKRGEVEKMGELMEELVFLGLTFVLVGGIFFFGFVLGLEYYVEQSHTSQTTISWWGSAKQFESEKNFSDVLAITYSSDLIYVQRFAGPETKISFPRDFVLKMWFCVDDANVLDAEDIAFNNNMVVVEGYGACVFRLERNN